jgi:MFS family permease
VAALNLLVAGFLRPVAGVLVDRYGSKVVALSGLALAAVALILSSQVQELWQFYLVYGVLLSVGYSFSSAVTTAPLVSGWFVSRRALALSFGSMGSGLGELVIVPIAAVMVVGLGWQAAYKGMAAFILLVVIPVGLLLIRDRPSQLGLLPLGGERETPGQRKQNQSGLTLTEAVRHGDFWRLGFGFLVCGFTMSFASTHFVPFAMEMDFEPMVAAGALGLVGGFSIMGSLTAGFLADRLGRKNILAVVYFLRGLAFIVLMHAHHNPVALYGGALLLGLSWTSTSPLSAAITADRVGLRHLGKIFGMMYTIMPIGSALGAVLAGYLHELNGGYEWTLVMSGAAGLLAAFVVAGTGGSRSATGPAAPRDRLPSPVPQARGSAS